MIESADLHKYLPSTVEMCSLASLLLRQYLHETEAEEFEIPPAPDQTIVLVTSGATLLEFYSRGSWRQSNHVRGNIVMNPPGETGKLRWRGVEHHEDATSPPFINHDKRCAGRLARPKSPDPLVTEVVLALACAARDGLPDLYAESAAHFLARHLLDRIDPGRSPRSGERARGRVEDYLRSHISDPVSLGDLALD